MTPLELFVQRWWARLLLLVGRRRDAMAVCRAVLEKVPQDVHALNSLAYDHLQSGHPALALPLFERVVVLTPELSNAHFNVAFVCDELGKFDQAEREFRAAIAIEEKMDRAWYGLGLVLLKQQRHDEALVVLLHNTKLQPMSPHAWYQMARIHVDLKQPDEAVKLIRHLKGFEPKVAAQLERETGLKAGQPI